MFQHHLIAFEILSDFSEIEEIRIKKNKDIIVHNYKMVVLRETVKKTFTKKQMYNCATFFTLTHCKKTRDQKKHPYYKWYLLNNNLQKRKEIYNEAVSYTHLTLPTKRIV